MTCWVFGGGGDGDWRGVTLSGRVFVGGGVVGVYEVYGMRLKELELQKCTKG